MEKLEGQPEKDREQECPGVPSQVFSTSSQESLLLGHRLPHNAKGDKKQIGNIVPPVMAIVISEEVKRSLMTDLFHPSLLGNVQLLSSIS